TMFKGEQIANFMKNQPVAAAKRIMDNCDNWSEESVTLLLLGPAKGVLLNKEQDARHFFGDRAVDLLKTLIDTKNAVDPAMLRDAQRIEIAEAVSAMSDQMIDRHLFKAQGSRFRHHDVRKNMLKSFQA